MNARLFVGNLSRKVTEKQLADLFSDVGGAVAVAIPLDRETRQPRGFAFVELADAAQAERALRLLDGTLFDGRKIRLSPAEEKGRRPGPSRPPGAPAGRARFEPTPLELVLPDQEDDRSWKSQGADEYAAKRRARPHGHGRHGSDRKHGRGTRRRID
ncbi:MAG: RNA-binding protein [Acidobacteriota bacterium]|nr:RNA-binding protein [Acidobacteriota bacterium]MDH3524278.1 RNA-binding protein [Acidobacteriota bacterium]